MKKKTLTIILSLTLLLLAAGGFLLGKSLKARKAGTYSAAGAEYKCSMYATMSPEEITASLSLEQKAAQMVMPAVYRVSPGKMKAHDYGSILSTPGSLDAAAWRRLVDEYQNAALSSEAGIPYLASECGFTPGRRGINADSYESDYQHIKETLREI